MKAQSVFCATVSEEVIVIQCLSDHEAFFLGASMPASARPRGRITSLTICPEKGKMGVVALDVRTWAVRTGKHPEKVSVGFLLPVTWEEGKPPFIDLEKPFISDPGRLGQVLEYVLQVTTGSGEVFTTSAYDKNPGTHHVPDGNFL